MASNSDNNYADIVNLTRKPRNDSTQKKVVEEILSDSDDAKDS